MKKVIFLVLGILSVFILTQCGDEPKNQPEIPQLTIDGKTEQSITMEEDEFKHMTLTGSGDYSIEVEGGKLTADIKAGKLVITAKEKGESKVILRDKKSNNTATVNVTVNAKQSYGDTRFVIDGVVQDEATMDLPMLAIGKQIELSFRGGSNSFIAEVTGGHVTAEFKGRKLTIAAKAVGEGHVTVTDTKTHRSIKLKIAVFKGKAVEKVEISGPEIRYLQVGKSIDFEATVKPDDAAVKDLTWKVYYPYERKLKDGAKLELIEGTNKVRVTGTVIEQERDYADELPHIWLAAEPKENPDEKRAMTTIYVYQPLDRNLEPLKNYFRVKENEEINYTFALYIKRHETRGSVKASEIQSEELTMDGYFSPIPVQFKKYNTGDIHRVYTITSKKPKNCTFNIKVTFKSGDVFEKKFQIEIVK